jgi:hypothetical protein
MTEAEIAAEIEAYRSGACEF